MRLNKLYLPDGLAAIFSIFNVYTESSVEPSWPRALSDKYVNNPAFLAWLESLGVTGAWGQPMSGAVGRAYPIGDSHIVKFTTDTREASAAAAIAGYNSDDSATVFGVRRLDGFTTDLGKKHLYAIVIEKLNTGIGKRARIAGDAVYKYTDEKDEFIKDPAAATEETVGLLDPKYKHDKQIHQLIKKLIYSMYNLQQQTGVLPQDPHGGNLGFKGSNPAVFDYGRSKINYDMSKFDDLRIAPL